MWPLILMGLAGGAYLFEKKAGSKVPVFVLLPRAQASDPPLAQNAYGTVAAQIQNGEVRTLPVQVVGTPAPGSVTYTILILQPTDGTVPPAGLEPGSFYETTREYVGG